MNIYLLLLLLATSSVRRSLADFPDVPLIDIGSWMRVASSSTRNSTNTAATTSLEQQRVVEEILEACRTVGFFTIVNHGVDPAVLEEAWKASADFFNLPMEEKMNHDAENDAEYPYGYEQKEQLSKGKALDGAGGPSAADDGIPVVESKETFAIGPDDEKSGMPLRRWVDTPSVPAFRLALEAYYATMEGLALRLLELFALALGQPVSFFEDKMDHHMSALRLIHYYPLGESANDVPRRIVRAGAHTDYGALTILNAGQPGLQVLRHDTENRNRTEWYSVPLVPGAFVINLGDLMQRWTNGMFFRLPVLQLLLFT